MTHEFKVGDQVRCARSADETTLKTGAVYEVEWVECEKKLGVTNEQGVLHGYPARRFEPVETPKTWGDMTDAEKCELLLAKHEGKTIQMFAPGYGWINRANPDLSERVAYRIKPVVRTVVQAVEIGPMRYVDVRVTVTDEDATDVELVK